MRKGDVGRGGARADWRSTEEKHTVDALEEPESELSRDLRCSWWVGL